MIHRRGLLRATLPGLAASAVTMAATLPRAGHAASGSAYGTHVRLSCNLYSFNDPLRSGAMSLDQALEICAELGFDAVDPTAYYFPGYPDAPPGNDEIFRVKQKAFRMGLAISGTGVKNDFALPDGPRAKQVAHVRRWLPFAARLGAPVLRVFAGKRLSQESDRPRATGWVVDGLTRVAREGAKHGVMIALQNHAEFLQTADQILEVLARVDSPALGLNLDIGSFPSRDPYADIERVVAHAVTWQIKEQVRVLDRQEKTDLPRVAAIIRKARYRGYLPLETLGEGDPRTKLRRFLDEVRTALA